MKKYRILLYLLTAILLSACVIPVSLYFRNKSANTVRLQCHINDRRSFDRLPNGVNFYDLTAKEKNLLGDWRRSGLVRGRQS